MGRSTPRAKSGNGWGYPTLQPPVGDLRWRAPRLVDAWEGPREAITFGEPCPQLSAGSVIGNEDCLHLNVWRPRTQERGLPVYEWIHGGGNLIYGNNKSNWQGDRLAGQSNLVVVSIQHRLGPLGWLYYKPLHTGDPLDDSGNFGLLDIIHSLQWIQENIEAFGGDSNNVTITGESSGAINIASLLLSEQASGLFHQAIIQSGYLQNPSPEEGMAWSAQLYDNLTALMGAPLVDPTDEELAQFMHERSAAELVEGYVAVESYSFTDGIVVPAEGIELFSTGEHVNKVPIIVGTNRDEYKLYTNPITSLAFGNEYATVTAEVRDGVGRYVSDLVRVRAADRFASGITSAPAQPDVYVYRFNWGSPDENGNSPLPEDWGQSLGAHHGLEVSFVLGNWEQWSHPCCTDLFFTEEIALHPAINPKQSPVLRANPAGCPDRKSLYWFRRLHSSLSALTFSYIHAWKLDLITILKVRHIDLYHAETQKVRVLM